jgi:large subunit ribosomal protein L25
MEKIILEAESRSKAGKGEARKLRAAGQLPAVLYGRGETSKLLSVNGRAFQEARSKGGNNAIISLQISGDKEIYNTIVKFVDTDRVKRNLLHIDFQRVYMDEPIKAMVPVRMIGEAPGTKEGGIIQQSLWEMEVEALPQELPEVIEADVSGLDMGGVLLVNDLALPEKVTILTDPETVVISVVAPHIEPEVTAALEEAAPSGEAVPGEEAAAPEA